MKTFRKVIGILFAVIFSGVCYQWAIIGDYLVECKAQLMEYDGHKFRDVTRVPTDEDRIRHRFELRRRHVMDLCSQGLYSKPTKNRMENIIVVDDYKLLYCSVPKTGCTNWKRIFLVLRGQYNSTDDIKQSKAHYQKFKKLHQTTKAETEEILKTYKKVMILRKPFARIVSGYRNKFEENSLASRVFRKPFVSQIIEKYRGNESIDSTLIKGENSVTFREFVRYLVDTKNGLSSLPEEHWRETYRLCFPCEINYDFIGHFETLYDDSQYILKSLNITIDFPASTNPTNSSDESVYREYYNQINSTEMERFKNRYRIDSLLFGLS